MIYKGKVVWFDDKLGYGFISWKTSQPQNELFVHFADIISDGFRSLKPGQDVKFQLGLNHSGKPKAIKVEISKEVEIIYSKASF